MKENVIDFNVIERVDYKINSIEGKKTESTATFESINVYLITYEFIVNSKLITITFSNEANLIRLQKPIVESIIETLTFK
mgnify:FL=1